MVLPVRIRHTLPLERGVRIRANRMRTLASSGHGVYCSAIYVDLHHHRREWRNGLDFFFTQRKSVPWLHEENPQTSCDEFIHGYY